jgi:hypothetical protein
MSEMMTLLVYFHQSGFRTFKDYYLHRSIELRSAFPGLVSYSRFIQLSGRVLMPLCGYLMSRRGKPTGMSFVDSTRACLKNGVIAVKEFNGLWDQNFYRIGLLKTFILLIIHTSSYG